MDDEPQAGGPGRGYRLDNTIEFDTSTQRVGDCGFFTEQRAADDAEIEINGISVTDSDNMFGSAIPGMDIEIYQTNTSAENVTVTLDKDQIESNVQSIRCVRGHPVRRHESGVQRGPEHWDFRRDQHSARASADADDVSKEYSVGTTSTVPL